jgi:CheY-like chemotaxis protein
VKVRVLLVDDDEDILESWRAFFEDRFDVTTARDGREALAVVDAQAFDVIVLDLMMPVMDGASFKRACDARGIATPVVIVSAGSDVRAQARAVGVVDVLSKPVDPDRLEAAIERLAGGGDPGGRPSGGGGSKANPTSSHSGPTASAV